MPFYHPPRLTNRRAVGDLPVGVLPNVQIENATPNDYILERKGIRSESSLVNPINRGEITSVEKGGIETYLRTVSSTTGTYEVAVTTRSLVEEDDDGPAQIVSIDDGATVDDFSGYDPSATSAIDEYLSGGTDAPESDPYTSVVPSDPGYVDDSIVVDDPPPAEVYDPVTPDVVVDDSAAPISDAFQDYLDALALDDLDPYGGV